MWTMAFLEILGHFLTSYGNHLNHFRKLKKIYIYNINLMYIQFDGEKKGKNFPLNIKGKYLHAN